MEGDEDKFDKLIPVNKMLLVLSHGQAFVECEFSISRKLECENLAEKSVVAQQVICDYVSQCWGVSNVPLTKEILKSASAARSRFQ